MERLLENVLPCESLPQITVVGFPLWQGKFAHSTADPHKPLLVTRLCDLF